MNTPEATPLTLTVNGFTISRTNLILAVVLLIQLLAVGLVYRPQTLTGAEGGPLLAGIAPDDIVSLAISDGDGNRIALAKTGAGWVMPEADDYPADETRISPVLEKLVAIDANRLVTHTPNSHKRLSVAADKFARRVTLTLAGGDEKTLYLGASAGPGATPVRLEGQNKTFLTNSINTWELNTQGSQWVDTLYFSLPKEDVTAFSLKNAHADLKFEQDAGGNWTLAGLAEDETLNAAAVTALLNRVTSVRLSEPVGREEEAAYGLNAPQVVITLRAAEQSYTLSVGAADEASGQYFFRASNSDYTVRVAEFTGKDLIDKKRADFIAPPPTPTAE